MISLGKNERILATKTLNKKRILGFLVSASLLSMASVAQAQVVTNEIVVTAQKKEENIQDIGIAVTSFSGEQIEALGLQTTADIVLQTPGLQVYEFSPSVTVYNIRGVSQNSFSDNLEGPIAVYIDDAYISALGAQNQPLFDIERVEILKGPQGTLYGRNATGGLIHYISKRPTNQFEANASASYGSYDLVDVEAAVSGPITQGIRARIAGTYVREDGYLKSTNPAVRDAYGKNVVAVKGFIEADLGPDTLLTLNPYWSKDSDVPTGAYVRRTAAQDPVTGLAIATPFPADPFLHSSDREGRFDREIFGITGKLEHEFGDGFKITSITNYQNMDKFYTEDTDGRNLTIGDIFGNPPFGPGSEAFAPLGVFGFTTDQDLEQFSQELRISGEGDRFSWQAGGFYLDIDQTNSALVEGLAALWFNPASGGLTTQARTDFGLKATSISLFAQGEVELSDQFKIVAGARWVRDDKDFDAFIRYQQADGTILNRGADGEVAGVYGPGFDGGLIAPICYSLAADVRCAGDVADPAANFKYSDWAGKLQLEFRPNNDLLIYAGVNRGTKGGNWATPAFPDSIRLNGVNSLSHTEETLWSYEAGFKATILDGRGRFNASAFYYDYKDYQAFSLTNFVQNITNNDARVYGLEFEFAASPVDGLDLLIGGSFLDSKVKGIATPFGVLVDTELPNAPPFSLNGLIRYAWDMAGGEMSVQVDGNFNGNQYLEVTNAASSFEKGYLVANAQIGFKPTEDIRLSAWVKNFTNEKYRVYSLDVAGAPAPFINDVFARPRTFGVTVSGSFN